MDNGHNGKRAFDLTLHIWLHHTLVFLKWLLWAAVIGIALGFISTAFHYSVDFAQELRLKYPWLLCLLPIGGLIIVFMYRVCGVKDDRGANAVLEATINGEPVKKRVAPLIFIGTVLTHLFGGSAGREGAALQLGGSIAGLFSGVFHIKPGDGRVLTICGMSAAFSALFGTPVTAAVFAVGVASAGAVQYAALFPSVISAFVGYFVSSALGVPPTRFELLGIPALEAAPVLQVLALSVLAGWLSLIFCKTIGGVHRLAGRIRNPYMRVFAGGCIVAAASLLLGTRDYCGAGMDVIASALAGKAVPAAFILKLLLTAVTMGTGFKGGEIVPSFFVGATFGCTAGALLGLDPAFGAAVGLTALFCGVTNCPITAIILSVELFGGAALPFFALACAASYLLSGYSSLYGAQRIVLDKWRIGE